jgi:regulation of enolase protein 1 (concanavalin A-like superfamily)
MKRPLVTFAVLLASAVVAGAVEPRGIKDIIFRDRFEGKLGHGWTWLREKKESWRVTTNALEVLIEPGNMWGPQNNARNVLLRDVPGIAKDAADVSVTVSNAPTHQYEQVDLVWYYDDSNMVKIGLELVDGKLSIVMGREEKDKIRTISITEVSSNTVRLRYAVSGGQIDGWFMIPEAKDWTHVGSCDLPPSGGKLPKVSLQFYQGAPDVKHWARVTDFEIKRAKRSR